MKTRSDTLLNINTNIIINKLNCVFQPGATVQRTFGAFYEMCKLSPDKVK